MNLLDIVSKEQLLDYLDVKETKLNHLLYGLPNSFKYNTFQITKKNGLSRTINSPNEELKVIQAKLKDDLLKLYGNKGCVHGFVKGKSILSNATAHLKKQVLINIDLKDFFSTIHFGRVRGMFLAPPFGFPEIIATLLAQICCFKGLLPQGAPTSPIISNFICTRLDNSFLRFSKANNFYYSRYADDITFSSNVRSLPPELGEVIDGNFEISKAILEQIISNGFEVNKSKIRLATRFNNQTVTGIKVNVKPNVNRLYIKQVRAILNSCEKYGVDKTAEVHFQKNNININKLRSPIEFFLKRLVGKISFIGFVRGKDDLLFRKLFDRIKVIVPHARLSIIYKKLDEADTTTIFTEGKTDWKHIKAALNRFKDKGLYKNLQLSFTDYLDEQNISNGELLKICEVFSKVGTHKHKIICIFDRDDINFLPKVTSTTTFYKDWSNSVYSMVLPVPLHCKFENICIEHYYEDQDLLTYDHNNRRIFNSTEFEKDGSHKMLPYIYKGKLEKLQTKFPTIIDSQVVDGSGSSIALSKNDFANYIYNRNPTYNSFKIEAFCQLLDHIAIIEDLEA